MFSPVSLVKQDMRTYIHEYIYMYISACVQHSYHFHCVLALWSRMLECRCALLHFMNESSSFPTGGMRGVYILRDLRDGSREAAIQGTAEEGRVQAQGTKGSGEDKKRF